MKRVLLGHGCRLSFRCITPGSGPWRLSFSSVMGTGVAASAAERFSKPFQQPMIFTASSRFSSLLLSASWRWNSRETKPAGSLFPVAPIHPEAGTESAIANPQAGDFTIAGIPRSGKPRRVIFALSVGRGGASCFVALHGDTLAQTLAQRQFPNPREYASYS